MRAARSSWPSHELLFASCRDNLDREDSGAHLRGDRGSGRALAASRRRVRAVALTARPLERQLRGFFATCKVAHGLCSFAGDLLAAATGRYSMHMSIYRLHDTTGDDLGLLEHPAPNLEPGDVVALADGRDAVVTARVEVEPGPGPLVAMLEVKILHDLLQR